MTDAGSQGIRGRRKSTYLAGSIVLLIVAAVLAITAYVTGARAMLWLAAILGLIALLLIVIGRQVRHRPPSHPDHPRLTHAEDHPTDDPA